MTTLYLMVGNVGSGKTTVAKQIQADNKFTMYISDDEICTMLNGEYSGEYWTPKHKKLYAALLGSMIHNILQRGFSVILDSGLHCISKTKRASLISIAKSNNAQVVAYDVSHPDALSRRLTSKRGNDNQYWLNIYNLFKDEYNQPSVSEGIDKIVTIIGKES